jgi:adenylosuccinate synthase
MKQLLILSGPIGVGKSSFAKALEEMFSAKKVSTRSWILEKTGCENERGALQTAGDKLDEKTGGAWVAEAVKAASREFGENDIALLDCARIPGQVDALKAEFPNAFHVHLDASYDLLERRYLARKSEVREFKTYAEAKKNGTEAQVDMLAGIADVVLTTDHTDPGTLAETTMALASRKSIKGPKRLVDVVVGGQFGSEGKGNICANIAEKYDALMRIGGPNAGHKVFEPKYTWVQLPSGTGVNRKAKILVGAGSTLWLPQLMLEILDNQLTPDRLSIDPQAMVISDTDVLAELGEGGLKSIATTGRGVGAANARKILNRGKSKLFGPPVKLARDIEQLETFVRDTKTQLDELYREGKRILLEGTQGTALSIHHGYYPYVTSRETSVSGCLADAGISPARVDRVIMVMRTFPIRVKNPEGDGETSGWMGREIEWEAVAKKSGIPVDELREKEKGSVSNRLRRVAEFDWGLLRRSTELNGATEVAITFADYLGVSNMEAKSFDELNLETQEFIAKVEFVAGVPVNLVSKAFAKDGVLKKGYWQ